MQKHGEQQGQASVSFIRIMGFRAMSYALVVLALSVSSSHEQPASLLIGDWRIVTYQRAGTECADEIKSKTKYYFTQRSLVAVYLNTHAEYHYTLKPANENNKYEIDLVDKKTPTRTKGLLLVKGNKLTLCLSNKGERPDSFSSDAEIGNDLVELEKD
ncbi:MAG: hypothetical protein QM703_26795 [Gemmatales bacterium]